MQALLIQGIPVILDFLVQIINAVKSDPGTPEEQKAKLDTLSADLKQCVLDVQAVQLPDKQ